MMQNIFIFLVAATASDADTTFTLIKKDAECKSSVNEEQYPMSASVETCADHCQKDPACTHFIYWNGENSFMAQLKRWQCWRETPKIGDDCGEDGFESDYFNFYRLDRTAGTTTMRTTVEGIGMTTATPLTTKPKTIEETQEWRDCLPRPFDLFFPTCTTLDLSSRGLIGSIPVDIKYMLNLETLNLADNELTGSIPADLGYCISLKHMYLQGNQFTGELPQQLFRLVFFFRLSVLNVGNNKLSGPVPLEYEGPRSEFFFNLTGVGSLKIVSYTLSEIFSDLWLLGNDWDGGPCAGFCVNTGPLDEAKRELSGVWAKKCFDDTSSHEILLDNKYSINELGQCLPKSPTCGQGYSYVTDRKIVSPDCRRCPIETYQSKSGHKENMCNDQPKCNPGEKISGDDADLRNMRKTCVPCEPNTYQDESDHRRTFCHEQTTCSLGQEISDYSATARQRCSPCPRGGFQNEVDHREMSCKPQPKCDAGQSFLTTSTDERQCTDCGESTYQSTQDEDALQAFCIEQPFCGLGQKMSAYSKTRRRTCSDCPFGMYQDQNEHRSENCKVQPPCKNPGTYYKATLYDERVCTQCPDRQYQEMSNHTTAECLLQRRCSLGFGFVGDQTTFGECIECNRTNGEYQDEDGHREPCKYQPICTQSREVVVVGTTTQKQVCVTKTATCSGVGKLLDDGITCNCNGPETGIGPTCSEHSNGKTCNGRGIATYNAITKLASCSNCTDPAIAVGDRCQFSNPTTCNSFGIVSINGTCTWNRNSQDEPIVSKCDAGYYYNPTPATITETSVNKAEEDAIEGSIDDCYPCSPGQFANGTARRVKCDECPVAKIRNDDGTFLDMLQTSEPASTSASDCFAKFQSAAADQQFCYGENIDAKPLSRIKSSDDCSISATSLGLTFAGEFVLPYPGCMYDEEHQEARFYVGQSQYSQALTSSNSDNNSDNDDNDNDDGSERRRRNERRQQQQRRRKQQQPREQDQQPQRRSHQKRRRKLKLVPMKDTPLCELYVCKDPKNEVTALTSDPADAGATPSCRVSNKQIEEAYAAEQAESQSYFMPAAFSLSAAALGGSYVHQYRSASKAGLPFTIWHHLGAWLTALRVFDMLTDFGFYFISLHGSEAFLEAYSDEPVLNECGQPETNPYEEPKVAAFLFISVFCTALGLFMTPLDVWAMSQRTVGGGMGIVGVAIVLSITLFEDTPQLALASIYINTMREVDIEPDPVSILSLAASALSMLFNVATVVYYTRKLRVQDPTGWWKLQQPKSLSYQVEINAAYASLAAENATLLKKLEQFETPANSSEGTHKYTNPAFNPRAEAVREQHAAPLPSASASKPKPPKLTLFNVHDARRSAEDAVVGAKSSSTASQVRDVLNGGVLVSPLHSLSPPKSAPRTFGIERSTLEVEPGSPGGPSSVTLEPLSSSTSSPTPRQTSNV